MPCNELLGDDLKLYWDTAGDYETPEWEEQINIGDLGLDFGIEQVEIPKRIGYKTYKKGRQDWELTFTCTIDEENTFHAAVLTVLETGDRIHLAVALGDIDTTRYWHAWFMLAGPLDAALDNPATIEVSGKIHSNLGEYCDEFPDAVIPE